MPSELRSGLVQRLIDEGSMGEQGGDSVGMVQCEGGGSGRGSHVGIGSGRVIVKRSGMFLAFDFTLCCVCASDAGVRCEVWMVQDESLLDPLVPDSFWVCCSSDLPSLEPVDDVVGTQSRFHEI